MAIVMMVPTALRPARRIAQGNSGRFTKFLVGYSALWSASVVIAFPLMMWVPWTALTLFIAWIAVGVYQLLPSTSDHLSSCRVLKSSEDPIRAGVRYGLSCASACLPLMIVAMATVHGTGIPLVFGVGAMALVMGYIMWEKSPRATVGAIRFSGAMMIAVAAIAFTSGGLPDHSQHSAQGAPSVIGESRS